MPTSSRSRRSSSPLWASTANAMCPSARPTRVRRACGGQCLCALSRSLSSCRRARLATRRTEPPDYAEDLSLHCSSAVKPGNSVRSSPSRRTEKLVGEVGPGRARGAPPTRRARAPVNTQRLRPSFSRSMLLARSATAMASATVPMCHVGGDDGRVSGLLRCRRNRSGWPQRIAGRGSGPGPSDAQAMEEMGSTGFHVRHVERFPSRGRSLIPRIPVSSSSVTGPASRARPSPGSGWRAPSPVEPFRSVLQTHRARTIPTAWFRSTSSPCSADVRGGGRRALNPALDLHHREQILRSPEVQRRSA